jgi:hypothetical protein
MGKQVKANDGTVQDEKRQPQASGDISDHQNVQGKALQMNENSAGRCVARAGIARTSSRPDG